MPGAFLSALDWLDSLGQIPKNIIRGNPAAAGRKAVDFLGDIVDAPLPGDWIPHISKPEDAISGGELIGLHDPGLLKTIADIGVDTLTNPASYLSFGAGAGVKLAGQTIALAGKTVDPLTLATQAAGKTANAGASLIDRVVNKVSRPAATTLPPSTSAVDTLNAFKRTAKNTLGWHDLDPERQAQLARAHGMGAAAQKTGTAEAERIMTGLTPGEHVALGDAFDALNWHANGNIAGVLPGATVADRLALLAQRDPNLRLPQLMKAAEDMQALAKTQWEEGKKLGAFVNMGDTSAIGRPDYLQRKFAKPVEDTGFGERSAPLPSAVKATKLDTPEQLYDYIQSHPEIGYERNAARRLVERSGQQGRLIERGQLGRSLVGPDFALADPEGRSTANAMIKTISETSPDTAYRLDQVFNGMMPRNGFASLMASMNRYFKPAAVYGVVIPKVGSIVRNQIGMVWQAMSTPGVPLSTQRHALGNLMASFDDGWEAVTKSRLAKGNLTGDLKQIEQAMRAGKGSAEAVTANLRSAGREDLAQAVEHGVMDGFVSNEEILKRATQEGWKGTAADIYHMPGAIFQGVEQRGRLGTFLDLLARNHGPEKAAQLTKDAYLDYSITGEANRTLRDMIPFAQWMAKTIPQQAKFLSRSPAAAVALGSVMGNSDEQPVYPWMENKTRIPLGLDEKGNPEYAVGLGLPPETLSSIPDFSGSLSDLGSSLRHNIVASMQPILKTAESVITGRDPYFDTTFGSYGKSPAERAYRTLAGTGLIQPLASAVSIGEQATDVRHEPWKRALNLLTGTNVASVDPDVAQQQIITQALEARPDVRQVRSYYSTEHDPELEALTSRLKEAKRALKAKRSAAAVMSGG